MKKIIFCSLVFLLFSLFPANSQTTEENTSMPDSGKAELHQQESTHSAQPKAKVYYEDEDVPEELKFYREKYEEMYDQPFEVVWKAIKKSLEDISCMIATENSKQDEQGNYRGVLKSDMCVFSSGGDTTASVLKKFSYQLPVILGGVWLSGRLQYTFICKELPDGKVSMVMRTEMSGFEDYVTHEVHFWKSNGVLEMQTLERIRKNIDIIANGGKN